MNNLKLVMRVHMASFTGIIMPYYVILPISIYMIDFQLNLLWKILSTTYGKIVKV